MIVLGCLVHIEDHRHLRIETSRAERREIRLSVEHQPVGSVRHGPVDEKERFHTAVGVGPGMAQLGPCLVRILHLQTNCHTTSRGSPRSIEYVS